MPSTGRNEPCPCGSGRKYKQCCGGAAAENHALPIRADRDTVFDLLDRLMDLPRFSGDVAAAYALIWGGVPDEDDLERLMDTPAGDLFVEWLWFDHLLHTGQTLAEYASAKHATDLGPGGRRFLSVCVAAPLRLLQVTRIEVGARVHVRDVIDRGEVIVVSERSGSQQLVRHDVITARLARYGTEVQFEGVNLLFGVQDKLWIASQIRRHRKPLARELAAGRVRERVLRMATGAAIVKSAIGLFDRPRPYLKTTDGDEMALADAVFGVLDIAAVQNALDRAPDLERDEPADDRPDELSRYTWLESPHRENGPSVRILGAAVLSAAVLRVETMSMSRARLAQDRFSALVDGGALRFKAIEVKSMAAAIEEAARNPRRPEPEIDPDLVASIQREFYEKHYREWLDLPVPALGNRTPREASRVKHLRGKLLALVEGIENQAERQAKERDGFDATFLRPALGLK